MEQTPVQSPALSEEDVIREHRSFVESQATQLMRQLHIRIDHEDLVAYGMMGLIQAWRRYDAANAASFVSFAFYRVRGAMIDGCRKEGWIPRERRAAGKTQPPLPLKAYKAANDHLEACHEAQLDEPPTTSMAQSVDRLTDMVGDALMIYFLEVPELATLMTSPPNQLDDSERSQEYDRLHEAIKTLDESEQAVIKRCHFAEESLTEVARSLGVSTSWCSRIHARALKKLRLRMNQEVEALDAAQATTA